MSQAAAPPGFVRRLSDDRLTRRAVGGDQGAFAAIFRRYHQSLYRFCLAIVGNPEDAQDALQNTMIKVLRALPGEERRIELKPWLYRVAHNESIDILRRRREPRELDLEQSALDRELAEDAATRERLRRLVEDLQQLPERQRGALVMRELAGLGFEEIGAAFGTTAAVARQTLYEARQSLRQMEEGREMGCEAVELALSEGDGRVTRRRDVRAHLRSCARCRGFRDEIKGRERDLAALSPLPAAAAAGMLHGLLGGGHGSAVGGGLTATLGGGATKTLGASAAVKGIATAAVVATIGVTAADRSDLVPIGPPGSPAARAADNDRAGGGPGVSSLEHRSGQPAAPRSAAPGPERTRAAWRRPERRSEGAADATPLPASAEPPLQSPDDEHLQVPPPGSEAAEPPQGAQVDSQPQAEPGAKSNGHQVSHPNGRGHEKQHPEAASKGQETAAAHKAPAAEAETKGNGQPKAPQKGKHFESESAPLPAPAPGEDPQDPAAGADPETADEATNHGHEGKAPPPGKAKGWSSPRLAP